MAILLQIFIEFLADNFKFLEMSLLKGTHQLLFAEEIDNFGKLRGKGICKVVGTKVG